MGRFVFLAIFAIILISTSTVFTQDYDEMENAEDAEYRSERQAVPYAALEPGSKGCARAKYKEGAYCGGYGVHNWCDTLCTNRGYPYSWCRPTYCVCHHGEDTGSFCKWTS